MLQFARGVRLGMDVGDLLELQRALHRDRVLHAAAEEQRVMLVDEMLGQAFNGAIQRQHLLDQARQLGELRHEYSLLPLIEFASTPCQRDRKQRKRRKLGCKCLRRRNTDLLTGMRHHHEI